GADPGAPRRVTTDRLGGGCHRFEDMAEHAEGLGAGTHSGSICAIAFKPERRCIAVCFNRQRRLYFAAKGSGEVYAACDDGLAGKRSGGDASYKSTTRTGNVEGDRSARRQYFGSECVRSK